MTMTITLTLTLTLITILIILNGFDYPSFGHGSDEDINGGSFDDGEATKKFAEKFVLVKTKFLFFNCCIQTIYSAC